MVSRQSGVASIGLMAVIVATITAIIGTIFLLMPEFNIPAFPQTVIDGMSTLNTYLVKGMTLISVWFGGWIVAISFSLIIANLAFWPIYSTVMWFIRKFGGTS